MGLASALLLVLVASQSFSSSSPPSAAAADDTLSPLLSPIWKGLCDTVWCGKGSCKASINHTFGFECECNPGWSQFHIDDHLRFLPCVVPNCSLNYSCDKEPAPAPAPFPAPPTNLSLFDPCRWSFCGGGSCAKTSFSDYKCDCKQGYNNLLNVTSFPCLKDCSLGADCAKLGITLSNSTANVSNGSSGYSPSRASTTPGSFVWLFFMVAQAIAAV